MTDQDLTPEAVERLIVWLMDAHEMGDTSKNPEVWRTLEALSAELEAERASHTATLKDAQDECARAEAAEAKLKEAVVKIKARIPNPVESQWDAGAKAGLIYAYEVIEGIGDKP